MYKRCPPLHDALGAFYGTVDSLCYPQVAPARFCANDYVILANKGCITEIGVTISILMKRWCSTDLKSLALLSQKQRQ